MTPVLLLAYTLWALSTPTVIFDFNENSSIQNWYVVDDGVMGGLSHGQFSLNQDGHAVFKGYVSLENNGGFSSVRFRTPEIKVSGLKNVVIRLKGDGKEYQFRVKAKAREYQSYIYTFSTSGEWQEIQIPLSEMYPSFHGRRLNMPNFDGEAIEEVTLLIGNKKAEAFQLMIDSIQLK